MIKATELRIGNWVNFAEDDTHFEITEITKEGLFVKNPEEETWIELETFSGIPLTPEILVKCGFEESYKSEYTRRFDHGIRVDVGAGWNLVNNRFHVRYIGEKFTHIKSLHQLQNLYYVLTGDELEIGSNAV